MTTQKPLATALNEVTTIILDFDKKTAYHETFHIDLTQTNTFTYLKQKYNIPKGDATHYQPSFIQVDKKLALFYEQHKTLAGLFDWFGLRHKAVYEVGYIYKKGQADPLTNPVNDDSKKSYDFALENFNIRHNTVNAARLKAVDDKLKRKQSNSMNWILIIGAVIVIVVVAIGIFSFMQGNPSQANDIVNATVTPSPVPYFTPRPTPYVIR
jgi:hypothetical protein